MKANGVGIGRVRKFPFAKTPLRRRILCIFIHYNNYNDSENNETLETTTTQKTVAVVATSAFAQRGADGHGGELLSDSSVETKSSMREGLLVDFPWCRSRYE